MKGSGNYSNTMITIKRRAIPDESKRRFCDAAFPMIQQSKYIKELDRLSEFYFDRSFRQLMWVEPMELVKLVEFLDAHPNKDKIVNEYRCINSNKRNDYIVKRLYKRIRSREEIQMIMEYSLIKVCPYCNRNYVDSFYSNNLVFHAGFDIDHFFPKTDYPMFAVSFYNLIPVCPSCNRYKGTHKGWRFPYDPDVDVTKQLFYFDIKGAEYLTKLEDLEVCLLQIDGLSDYWKDYYDCIFKQHVDIVQDILRKKYFYGKGYYYSIIKQFGRMHISEDEINRFVFGRYLSNEDFSKYPLSKFSYDIFKQCGL